MHTQIFERGQTVLSSSPGANLLVGTFEEKGRTMFVDGIWWAEGTMDDSLCWVLRASGSSLREVGNNDRLSILTASHKSNELQHSCNTKDKRKREKKNNFLVYWNPSSMPDSCWRGFKVEIGIEESLKEMFYLWITVGNGVFCSRVSLIQLFAMNMKKMGREPVRRNMISIAAGGLCCLAK